MSRYPLCGQPLTPCNTVTYFSTSLRGVPIAIEDDEAIWVVIYTDEIASSGRTVDPPRNDEHFKSYLLGGVRGYISQYPLTPLQYYAYFSTSYKGTTNKEQYRHARHIKENITTTSSLRGVPTAVEDDPKGLRFVFNRYALEQIGSEAISSVSNTTRDTIEIASSLHSSQ